MWDANDEEALDKFQIKVQLLSVETEASAGVRCVRIPNVATHFGIHLKEDELMECGKWVVAVCRECGFNPGKINIVINGAPRSINWYTRAEVPLIRVGIRRYQLSLGEASWLPDAENSSDILLTIEPSASDSNINEEASLPDAETSSDILLTIEPNTSDSDVNEEASQ
jgi:hypothetical protein